MKCDNDNFKEANDKREAKDEDECKNHSLDNGTSGQSCTDLPTAPRSDLGALDQRAKLSIRPSPPTSLSQGPHPEHPNAQTRSLVDGNFFSKQEPYKTSVDAVHPFFTSYRNIKKDESTSTDNQMFYCRQCGIYIELCHEAVKEHFITKQHIPIQESCVYCQTGVYEYFYNENQYYYHRCPSEHHNHNSTAGNPSKKSKPINQ